MQDFSLSYSLLLTLQAVCYVFLCPSSLICHIYCIKRHQSRLKRGERIYEAQYQGDEGPDMAKGVRYNVVHCLF